MQKSIISAMTESGARYFYLTDVREGRWWGAECDRSGSITFPIIAEWYEDWLGRINPLHKVIKVLVASKNAEGSIYDENYF